MSGRDPRIRPLPTLPRKWGKEQSIAGKLVQPARACLRAMREGADGFAGSSPGNENRCAPRRHPPPRSGCAAWEGDHSKSGRGGGAR
jgi:hypothetical protein